MADSERARTRGRAALTWVGLAAVIGALAWQGARLPDVRALGLGDFVAYWSAGRLNARGEDPYSPAGLLPVQQEVGWTEDWPNIMYYPPWALALVMPLGLLPFWTGRLIWLLVNLGLVLWSADLLWTYFGGPRRLRGIGWALALSFIPTLIALRMGQIGPVLLAGIALFLVAERRGWDWLAGAALALPAIKPQLVYLFGLAVLTWALDRRRWRLILGGVVAMMAMTATAVAANPQVLSEYRYALANPPSGNVTPTIGALLRLAFGEDRTWLQFIPTAVGLAWFGWHWTLWRADWRWDRQAPVLLLASFLTTAYGAWVFDVVVLLVPLTQGAVWLVGGGGRRAASLALLAFLAFDGAALAMNLGEASYPAFIWLTPVILGGYLVVRHTVAGTEGRAALAG